MSKKTGHFQRELDKIHHREIQNYKPGRITEKYPDFTLKIFDGVTCVEPTIQSKISFREIPEEVIVENIDVYFREGGGRVVRNPFLGWQKLEPEDESVPVLEIQNSQRVSKEDENLFNFFGGNLSITTNPQRFIGAGF